VRAFDDVEGRKGYSGLYRSVPPTIPENSRTPASTPRGRATTSCTGWRARALWRVIRKKQRVWMRRLRKRLESSGASTATNAAHGRAALHEPLPLHIHNTMSLGYVRNSLSPQFSRLAYCLETEQGVEFNALLDVFANAAPAAVVQYYAKRRRRRAARVVFGFRTKRGVLGNAEGNVS